MPTEIDIIILSYAQSDELQQMTTDCITSLIESEDPASIKFNIVVIESQKLIKPYQYPGTTTIYPDEEFGYHRYLNIGIASTSAPYICLCNNDLIFHQNWASNIMQQLNHYPEISSASPLCPVHQDEMEHTPYSGNHFGYRIGKELAGWCIFIRREIFKKIGILDPNFKFWFADNDYVNTIWVLGLKHALITSSLVTHVKHLTISQQNPEFRNSLTFSEQRCYEGKWYPRMGGNWRPVIP